MSWSGLTALRQSRRARGLCPYCPKNAGVKEPLPGRHACDGCLQRNLRRAIKYKTRKRKSA